MNNLLINALVGAASTGISGNMNAKSYNDALKDVENWKKSPSSITLSEQGR